MGFQLLRLSYAGKLNEVNEFPVFFKWDASLQISIQGGTSTQFSRGGDAPSVLEVPPIKFVVNIIVGLYLSISTVHMLAVIDDMRHPSIIIEPLV